MDFWSRATGSVTLLAKNSTISTPYTETSPMVALREHPIPKTQLDSAIFEVSEEDEYHSVTESFKHPLTAATPAAISRRFPSSSLLKVVGKRDYVGANRVREEMIQHQFPITPNHAFIHLAVYVVLSRADPAMKLKEFCGWLSLLPIATKEEMERPKFGRLMYLLSKDPRPHVDLIMAFVRICVSKGYTLVIPEKMIPLVVRFAPPSVSLQFLEDLRSLVVENLILDGRMWEKIRRWCKAAVKEYLDAGLIKESSEAFQIFLQYDMGLPRVPFLWLKMVLENPGHFGLPKELVTKLKRRKTYVRYEKLLSRPGLTPATPSVLSPLGLDRDPPSVDSLYVADFLEICDAHSPPIRRLFARNQHKLALYRKQWILGEMLYYSRRKRWRQVIGAFDTYFFHAGVPEKINEHKSRGRFTLLNVHQRLFPSACHTSLVWRAAVEILQQRGRPVSPLFKELVEQVAASKTRECVQSRSSLVSASTQVFDEGHFTPFFIAMYRKRLYKHLVLAFDKMSHLGIEPSVEQLSLLAGAYAGIAKSHEVFHTLDRMEGVLRGKGADISRDAALYLPALRRFIERLDNLGASLVARRILRGGYVKGTNPDVDRRLARLKTPI